MFALLLVLFTPFQCHRNFSDQSIMSTVIGVSTVRLGMTSTEVRKCFGATIVDTLQFGNFRMQFFALDTTLNIKFIFTCVFNKNGDEILKEYTWEKISAGE